MLKKIIASNTTLEQSIINHTASFTVVGDKIQKVIVHGKTEALENIRDSEIISFLSAIIHDELPEIRLAAARTIIEEVYEDKYADLRLKAFEILLPLMEVPQNHTAPSFGQVDMHTHTRLSDGYVTPTAYILEAYEEGLFGIALTDHNIMPAGPSTNEAYKASKILNKFLQQHERNFQLIAGIELDNEFHKTSIHTLLYFPNYFDRYDELMGNPVVIEKMHKLSRLDEERVHSTKNLLENISKQFPEISMKWETFLTKVRASQISRALVTDELVKAFPEYFKAQGITMPRDGWKKWLPAELKPSIKYKNRLSLNDTVELIKATGAKFAMAHPEEVFQMEKKKGQVDTIEKYFSYLISAIMADQIPSDSILGISYFSAKLQNPLERNRIRQMFYEICQDYDFMHRDNLFLLPESDGHGKKTTGPVGRGIDYPANSTIFRQKLYEALGIIEKLT